MKRAILLPSFLAEVLGQENPSDLESGSAEEVRRDGRALGLASQARAARSEMRIAALMIILPALLCGALFAQQAPGGPLTWDDCVAVALRKNPDLASSLDALEAGKASYHGSFNGLMPNVTLSNGYNDGSSFKSSSSGSSSGSPPLHWTAEARASVNLFNAGTIAGIRSASASVSQSQAGLRQTSSSVRFSLRQAFAQLLFVEKNVEVSRAILAMRQKSAEMVVLRYNSGAESKGNMMRSKAQALQAQADLNQALRNVKSAQTSLDRQLGFDEFAEVTATGTLETASAPEMPSDPRSLLASRPDVALQQAVIKSAEAGVSSARSSLWPTLSANYSRERLGGREFPSDRYSWSFGGLLSYPLFGGGPTATYYAVSAAKRSLEKARQDLRTVSDQAVSDLQSSWTGFAGAVDQVAVQAALLTAARQRNDEADIRYASGLMSFDNWEIIASDRINQERQAIQARLNAVNAEAAWAKSLGKALGE